MLACICPCTGISTVVLDGPVQKVVHGVESWASSVGTKFQKHGRCGDLVMADGYSNFVKRDKIVLFA